MDMKSYNEKIIKEFRQNGGKVSQFGDLPMVILHSRGAKTGEIRLIPLVVTEESDGVYIFGSYAGAKKDPGWVHNLRAHPDITVEYGTETYTAKIEELDPEQAKAKVSIQQQRSSQFAAYVSAASPREIPVFTIKRQ
ncbi:MAG: deazaflavin-dependent oxidoreductase (nitroreductase family) [Candidatus Azotimanducaceae bacterium]|jgi:deazaflavin-dependent oxidoreductase (nitroreductase family)